MYNYQFCSGCLVFILNIGALCTLNIYHHGFYVVDVNLCRYNVGIMYFKRWRVCTDTITRCAIADLLLIQSCGFKTQVIQRYVKQSILLKHLLWASILSPFIASYNIAIKVILICNKFLRWCWKNLTDGD